MKIKKFLWILEDDTFYITPRIIAILFVPLISLFVIDVFNGKISMPFIPVALFIHLIPSLAVLFALMYAWKHEKLGGAIFLLLFIIGLIYFKNPYPSNLILFAPLLLAGLLFEIHSNLFSRQGRRIKKIYKYENKRRVAC